MSLNIKENGGGDFEIVPEGTYIARCYRVVDLGTQVSEFQGERKEQPKVLIGWELLDDEVKMKDGRPFSTQKRYTASLHEKSQLRKDLQNWRGKRFTPEELEGFDLKNVLGTYCQMQITHVQKNDRTYDTVDAIMATKEKPAGVNDLIHYDIHEPDAEVFNSFSDKLRETIAQSPEYIEVQSQKAFEDLGGDQEAA